VLTTTLVLAGCSGGSGDGRTSAPTPAPTGSRTPSAAPPAAAPTRLSARRASWRLPDPRSREVAVDTAGGLVVAGGLSSAKVSTSTVWTLDPSSGHVLRTGSLADPVHDAAGALLGRTPVVVAGGNTTTIAAVQRVQSATASVIGQLPQPRSDLDATALEGALYVLGGFDGATSLAPVLRSTDGRHFTTVGRLPVTVRYAAAVGITSPSGDRLLVFGGEHNGVAIDDVQEIDVRTGRSHIVGHLHAPLAHESAFVLGDQVWLAGGRSSSVLQSRLWQWDVGRRRARPAGRLPYAVADAPVAVNGTTAYLLGGETPDPTDRVVVLRTT
jgi:hypothetical protein